MFAYLYNKTVQFTENAIQLFWSETPSSQPTGTYAAQTVYEINYTDKTYWQAHFTSALEDFKQDIFDCSAEELKAQLWDWQGLIGKQTLSPLAYEQGIRELADYVSHHPDKSFVETTVFTATLMQFKQDLAEQTAFTLENFEADVLQRLEGFIKQEISLAETKAAVRFYKGLVPENIYNTVEKKLQPLLYRDTITLKAYQQFRESLSAFLAEAQAEFQQTEENAMPSDATETISENKSHSSLWNTVKSLGDYVIHHPVQAITAGLALQVAAAAALGRVSERGIAKRDTTGEFQVNTYTTSDQQYSSSATFPNNNFVVTWQSYNQTGDGSVDIYCQLFNATGGRIASKFRVNTYTASDQYSPSVATFVSNNFVVTWTSSGQDSSGLGIYGQLFNTTGGIIGPEFRVNTYTASNQGSENVATFPNNNFVVVWDSLGQDGSGYGVYGQLFNATGGMIGSEFRANTYISNDQHLPSVATFPNNNFVATWESNGQDGSGYGIYGQLFNVTGGRIGPEFRVNTYTMSDQRLSPGTSVATFPNNNFVATWQSFGQDSSGDGVYGQLFNTIGGTIGAEFQVNTYTMANQGNPRVAMFPNNNFVVAWDSFGQDGSDYGIYGQLFNTTGGTIGAEFQVNTYTTNIQGYPSVTAFPNNNFVVTWDSFGQDGSGWGIYGRIFDTTPIIRLSTANQTVTYTEDVPQFLPVFSIQLSFWLSTVATNLTVIPVNSGVLSTGSYGSATSTFNPITGIWQTQGLSDDVNALLASLTFYPSLNFNQNVTINAQASNSYAPDVLGTINLIGIPVNDAPMLSQNTTTVNYVEKDPNGVVIGTNLVVDDMDSTLLSAAEVGIMENFVVSEDQLLFNNTGAIIGNYNTATGSLTFAGTDTLASYQTVLRNVRYRNLSNNPTLLPKTISFQVNDGQLNSAWLNQTVTLTPVNDPPVVQTSVGSLLYTANAAQIKETLDSGLAATDVDSANLANATVWFSGGWTGSEDQLAFTNQNGIIGDYNPTTGVLSLTGSSPVAFYQAALKSVQYYNLLPNPALGLRTVSFQANDGQAPSDIANKTITVEAPLMSTTGNSTPPTKSQPSNNNVAIIAGAVAGTAASLCLLGGLGFFAYRRRQQRLPRDSAIELEGKDRIEKGRTLIGNRFELVNKITREEAQQLLTQTGIQVTFQEGKKKDKFVLGQGQFGQLKLAYDKNTHQFIGVKKIKGSDKIAASTSEADLQQSLNGQPNILPLMASVQTTGSNDEAVIYQFLPLAGFGNGEALQAYLVELKTQDPGLWMKTLLHTAKSWLTGLSAMHQAGVCHLDIKPANLVVDQHGAVFIIDFGCAASVKSSEAVKGSNGDVRYYSPERLHHVNELQQAIPSTEQKGFDGAKADVYALGISLLNLVLGQEIMEGMGLFDIVRKGLSTQVHAALEKVSQLTVPGAQQLHTLLTGLLAEAPEARLSAEAALKSELFETTYLNFTSDAARRDGFAYLKTLANSKKPVSTLPTEDKAQAGHYQKHYLSDVKSEKFAPSSSAFYKQPVEAQPSGQAKAFYSPSLQNN